MDPVNSYLPIQPAIPQVPTANVKGVGAADAAQAVRQAKDFEGLLLHKLLEEMQNTVPQDGLLDGSATQQVQGLFNMYLAQDLADKGGLGLWHDIYRQIQGHAAAAPPVASASQQTAAPGGDISVSA